MPGHHHHGKASPQTASVSTSDAQQALNQLTDTLTQQADGNGTVSGSILRQDLQQLFQNLKGQNNTSTIQSVA
jgi:hypothetical protein